MPWSDGIPQNVACTGQFRWFTLDCNIRAAIAVRNQRLFGRAEREDPGQRSNSVFELSEEAEAAGLVIAVETWSDRELQDMIGMETQIKMLQVVKAADETPGAGDEKKSEGDLGNHKGLPQTRVGEAGRKGAGLLLESGGELNASGTPGRGGAKPPPHNQSEGGGKT